MTNQLYSAEHYSTVTSCAVTQDIPSILWNQKVHCRIHKSHRLVIILSQISPVHTTPSYLTKIYLTIIVTIYKQAIWPVFLAFLIWTSW
jgi:hypothetical protein